MDEEKTLPGDDVGEKCKQIYLKVVESGKSITMLFNEVRVIMFPDS